MKVNYMSRNEHLLSKENFQNFIMNPGPSNHSVLGLPTTQKYRQTSAGRAMKQTWTCGVCRKELSSKRSYTEHMNIHNKSRPFQCDNCAYAAASQMTLHRHKLRNHTPKTEWGYRCPYCEDAYMEPAGYQQHVQQRHAGRSATYGCPFRTCKFTSKSQRHFREHLVKHDRGDKIEGGVDPCSLSNQQLTRYMVTDEIGLGFHRPMAVATPTQTVTIRARPQVKIAPQMYAEPPVTSSRPPGANHNDPQIVLHLERVIPKKTIIRTNQIIPRHTQPSHMPRYYTTSNSTISAPTSSSTFCEPLAQTYDQIHPEFIVEADESDFEAAMNEEDYADDLEEEVEEVEEDAEEEFDDEPPVLESFESPNEMTNHVMDNNWMESEAEATNNDGLQRLPNGFIDEELD